MKKVQIAVLGGGASGLMAAIQAAYIGADTVVLEKNPRVGKKILSTGNGKCNFSHSRITADDYYGTLSADADAYLQKFSVQDTLDFFEQAGMLWKNKNNYLYPLSEQASMVADVLRCEAERLGVGIRTDCNVEKILVHEDGRKERFSLCAGGKEILACEKLIAAFGGMAAPATGSDGSGFSMLQHLGIPCEPLYPALTKLLCADSFCKALAGVRSEAVVTLCCDDGILAAERGEVQFTAYGLSGIPVFQLSRIAAVALRERHANVKCSLDLLPDMQPDELEQFLLRRLHARGTMSGEVFLNGLLHKKLSGVIGREAGIRYADTLTDQDEEKVRKFACLCKQLVFHVTGTKGFDEAQVTAGGIGRKEVTSELESVRVKGLFLAGELLDLDGKCGGFNLQWAWTSGAIAGRAAANQLEAEG